MTPDKQLKDVRVYPLQSTQKSRHIYQELKGGYKHRIMKGERVIIAASIVMILIASFASLALAQSTDTSTDTAVNAEASAEADINADAGITPDSGWYGIKLGLEKFRLAFIFKQEAKASEELRLAHKRLVEARAMADKGDSEAFAKAEAEYESLMASIQARLSSIDKDGSADNVRASAKTMVSLERTIEVHQYNIDKLKARLDESNITDEERAMIEAKISRMEDRSEEFKEKLDEKEDRIKVKLRAITEKSEDEVEEEIERMKESVNIEGALEARARTRIDFVEHKLPKLEAYAEEQARAGANVSNLRIAMAEAREDLARAKLFYEQKNYEESIAALKRWGEMGGFFSELRKEVNEAKKEAREKAREEVKEAKEDARETMKKNKERAIEELKETQARAKEKLRAELELIKERNKAKASAEAEAELEVDVELSS